MTDKELNAAVQAAFAANPEAKQFHVIATGDCFTNELDARHAARQLGEHERGVRVVTRPHPQPLSQGKGGVADDKTSEAAPANGAPAIGDGASVDADGDGGAGSINAEEEAAGAAPKKAAKKKK